MNSLQIAKMLFKAMVLGFVSLVVLESSARIDDWIKWDAPLFGNYSRGALTLVDSLGIRNRPNSQFEKWVINSHCFRGGEIEKKAPEGVIRIMVLGASEAFGLYEAPGKEFPAQLQEILNRDAPGRYQVINAAVPGLSPPRILHLYDNWLVRFKPDIVVYYPSFTGYLMRKPPAAVSFDGQQVNQADRFNLRIKTKVFMALKRFIPADIQTYLKKILIKRSVRRHPTEWVFQEVPSERADLLERHLNELVSRIKKSGTIIVLSTHATAIANPVSGADIDLLTGWRKLYPHVAEGTFLEMERTGNKIIEKVAKETSCYLVDIDAELAKNREHFADHVHFTTLGASAVARLFADHIIKNQGKIFPRRRSLLPTGYYKPPPA